MPIRPRTRWCTSRWVWDKNRPSRIIPRTEVHTTQDVTVEELKTESGVDTTLPIGFELGSDE